MTPDALAEYLDGALAIAILALLIASGVRVEQVLLRRRSRPDQTCAARHRLAPLAIQPRQTRSAPPTRVGSAGPIPREGA